MVMSKHFFSEAGSIRHRKQEGLQPSLVALFKCCKQPSSKGFCFVLTSAGMGISSNLGAETINQPSEVETINQQSNREINLWA